MCIVLYTTYVYMPSRNMFLAFPPTLLWNYFGNSRCANAGECLPSALQVKQLDSKAKEELEEEAPLPNELCQHGPIEQLVALLVSCHEGVVLEWCSQAKLMKQKLDEAIAGVEAGVIERHQVLKTKVGVASASCSAQFWPFQFLACELSALIFPS